jgi:hypothetical protein
VFGTKRKVHSANTLIGIVNQTATAMANDLPQEERKLHRMVLCVPKNRDGAIFTFRQIMDSECGKFYEDTDTTDAAYNALERQANEMINDTAPLGKQRSEIDMQAILEAKKDELNEQVKRLNAQIQAQSNSLDADDFINEGIDNADAVEQDKASSALCDDFINDCVDEQSDVVKEESEATDENDFLNESPKVEKEIVSETHTANPEIVEKELQVAKENGVGGLSLKELAKLSRKL